jgi:SRSO17 transposase
MITLVGMTRRQLRKLDQALEAFLDELTAGMGRRERQAAMQAYVQGLLLDGERKSMQPMAERLADEPGEVEALRQRMQECVSQTVWDERELLRRLALKVEAELPGVEALVVDDTGFAKKGEMSVGVARQYSGTLGRTDNCQVAVSLHLASEAGSACIGFRLYLPQSWACDPVRCDKAKVPDDVDFETKWRISLRQLQDALSWGVRPHVVLADAGYGEVTAFRDGLSELGLSYVVGVPGGLVVWLPGAGPDEPGSAACSIKALVTSLPASAWKTVRWREGSKGPQSSRFCALRVRTARGHTRGHPPGDEQWLLAQWPAGDDEPSHYFLSTLPKSTSLRRLVRLAKLRWRVERDYQEMKGELGLDHFEGRGWPGFHHHAALCAVAHAFLSIQRALFPPDDQALDLADGPQGPSADPHPEDRLLPPLPLEVLAARPATRAVADLIK